jgi:hypothetical protein
MAEQQPFNKVVYIDRIKRAGITEHEARAHAQAIEQELRGSLATKPTLSWSAFNWKAPSAR